MLPCPLLPIQLFQEGDLRLLRIWINKEGLYPLESDFYT